MCVHAVTGCVHAARAGLPVRPRPRGWVEAQDREHILTVDRGATGDKPPCPPSVLSGCRPGSGWGPGDGVSGGWGPAGVFPVFSKSLAFLVNLYRMPAAKTCSCTTGLGTGPTHAFLGSARWDSRVNNKNKLLPPCSNLTAPCRSHAKRVSCWPAWCCGYGLFSAQQADSPPGGHRSSLFGRLGD